MRHPSSQAGSVSSGDPLTDLLRGLRLDGVEYGRCELTAPWAVLFPAQAEARFHFIGPGGCWLQTPQGEWTALTQGDAVLLPRGSEHVLASAPGVPPRRMEAYEIIPACATVSDVRGGGGGSASLLFCGSMRFSIDGQHPLMRMMPEVMRSRDLAASAPVVPQLIAAMIDEVSVSRIGGGGVLARLADVLAASLIRDWVEHEAGDATGWIAAVRSPDIGRVLAAIHLDPGKPWTVPSLARMMGASRSRFAERFAAVVGETPGRYIARVRMSEARTWLGRDGLKIPVVARRLGYESDAAFSRAFKRIVGVAPGQVRSRGRQAAADRPGG